MAVIHISEAEAAQDFYAVLAKVRAGESVHIDTADKSFAIVPVPVPKLWTVDEAIRRSEEAGVHAFLDDEYADQMEELMRINRLPRESEQWASY
jgi:antitoxin (DNA-binding transcriptional repressor) of toxin-antitoxin stability system